jgi:hypothetical protein
MFSSSFPVAHSRQRYRALSRTLGGLRRRVGADYPQRAGRLVRRILRAGRLVYDRDGHDHYSRACMPSGNQGP